MYYLRIESHVLIYSDSQSRTPTLVQPFLSIYNLAYRHSSVTAVVYKFDWVRCDYTHINKTKRRRIDLPVGSFISFQNSYTVINTRFIYPCVATAKFWLPKIRDRVRTFWNRYNYSSLHLAWSTFRSTGFLSTTFSFLPYKHQRKVQCNCKCFVNFSFHIYC